LLAFDSGVNISIGLPIIRTFVDHDTAFDIAGTGRARENSVLAAINVAVQMAHARATITEAFCYIPTPPSSTLDLYGSSVPSTEPEGSGDESATEAV
jgi:hypothetical protein